MKKFIFFFSLIIILHQTPSYCSIDESIIFSPGFKIGYSYGDYGGFVFGLELTVGKILLPRYEALPMFYGAVLNIDVIRENFRFSLSGEYQAWPIPGITLGPSLLIKDGNSYLGLNFSTYLSLVFLNFTYNYSYFNLTESDKIKSTITINMHEIVTQIKFPFVQYPNIDIGG